MKKLTVSVCLLLSLITCCAGHKEPRPLEYPAGESGEVLITYEGFAVSYCEEWRIPRWVAYELMAEETDGVASKSGKGFRQDWRVKALQANHYDYRGSGWSRGHMAPAADFKWSDKALDDTFFYTNCCPQNSRLNNGPWNILENKVRAWAKHFGQIWVVTGPVVSNREHGTLGATEVVIPDAFFKALLVRDGETWSAIGFVMSNDDAPHPLPSSCCTVDDLEALTGLDFFSSLPNRTERAVESAVDLRFWGL